MKITKKQLKQIIKEELNPYLTGQGAEVERSAAKANRYEDWFQRALDGGPDPEKNQTFFDLAIFAKKDPDAQAVLDGVYETSPAHKKAMLAYMARNEGRRLTTNKLKQMIKEEFAKVLNEETPAEERAREAKEEMERQMGGYDDDDGDDQPAKIAKPVKKPAPAKKPAARPKWKPAGPPEKAKGTVPKNSKYSNFKLTSAGASIIITTPEGVSAEGKVPRKSYNNPVKAKRKAEHAAQVALMHKLKRK